MQAEIIANGDELVSGKILDTNTQWLCRELAELGVTTLYHTTVGDEREAMVDVLRIASNRADLILWTGGLGPTADDLTRQAVADLAGVTLVKNDDSVAHIRETFRRRGREMPKANEIQAFQPEGAVPIYNPHGTAPGIDMTVKRQGPAPEGRLDFFRVLCYPGVPAEMKEMWHDSGEKTVQKLLEQLTGHRKVIRFRSINSFGLGESQVEAMLPDIVNRKHYPKVGITATQATITLRIAAEGETEDECFKIMEPTAKIIYETLGDIIYGEGDDTLQDIVCRAMKTSGKTMAVIEAGTRGLLAESLARSPDSTGCFAGGIVLPPKEPVAAEEMIRRGRRLFNVDYLLLIGAFPPGKPDRNRTETAFVAVVDARKTEPEEAIVVLKNHAYVGHPGIIDDLYVKRVLDLTRRTMN